MGARINMTGEGRGEGGEGERRRGGEEEGELKYNNRQIS